MQSIRRQLGITLSGLIIGLIVIGGVAVILMKLWPLYNEKLKADQAMAYLEASPTAPSMGKADIVRTLMRQFDISDIDHFDTPGLAKVVTVGRKKGTSIKVVILEYEIRTSFFGNLDLIMNYRNVKEFGPVKAEE